MPCECSLEGSSSLQCSPVTGQCPCLAGAGISGRRCDQCVSPLAEMISAPVASQSTTAPSTSCRQLTSQQCPKQRTLDIWWPRTTMGARANASCPRGSSGVAYRTCAANTHGWLRDIDLSECHSNKIVDAQFIRLDMDKLKTELNSYQVACLCIYIYIYKFATTPFNNHPI